MKYTYILLICVGFFFDLEAQIVDVQANYNGVGNVDFIAHNNSRAPLFLNIDFADLQNTTFRETLPYIKRLEPGFNSLFTLERYGNGGSPRFNYKIKYFRSNPRADVDLDFPYLIPFDPGSAIKVFDVKNIEGFWGSDSPKSWHATGFYANPGEPVYASRNGLVVEIAGNTREGETQSWYNGWKNTITVLQPDESLICYHNVVDKTKKLKVNSKIFAGQLIGEVSAGAKELLVLIYHDTFNENKELFFVIPEFVVDITKTAILNPSLEYKVVHPMEIIVKEMTSKEKRKYTEIKK